MIKWDSIKEGDLLGVRYPYLECAKVLKRDGDSIRIQAIKLTPTPVNGVSVPVQNPDREYTLSRSDFERVRYIRLHPTYYVCKQLECNYRNNIGIIDVAWYEFELTNQSYQLKQQEEVKVG